MHKEYIPIGGRGKNVTLAFTKMLAKQNKKEKEEEEEKINCAAGY